MNSLSDEVYPKLEEAIEQFSTDKAQAENIKFQQKKSTNIYDGLKAS